MELSTDKSGDTIPLLKQSQHQYRSTSSPMEGTAVTVTPSIAAQHLYAAWGDHMILTDISFEVKMVHIDGIVMTHNMYHMFLSVHAGRATIDYFW